MRKAITVLWILSFAMGASALAQPVQEEPPVVAEEPETTGAGESTSAGEDTDLTGEPAGEVTDLEGGMEAAGETTAVEDEESGEPSPEPREETAQPPASPKPGAEAETTSKRWFDEYSELVESYKKLSGDYQETIREYLMSSVSRRIKEIESSRQEQIDRIREMEATKRQEAIRSFKDFLGRYKRFRGDPQYRQAIADAMFRLAQLYRDEAEYESDVNDAKYEERLKDWEHGVLHTRPVQGQVDYRRTLELYEELVLEFPEYRYRDMVLYLWGFFLRNQDDLEGSVRVLTILVTDYPRSEYRREAFFLIGHNNYDMSQFEAAAKAYKAVVDSGIKGETYYFSLYRLGWADAEMFRHPEAIATFMLLLSYIKEHEREIRQSGSLKKEAIESIAASFVDDDWDGDANRDADFGPQRALSRIRVDQPYAKELLKYYGDLLYEFKRVVYWRDAITVYREYLRRYPLDENNPIIHDRIIYGLWELSQSPELTPGERERYLNESLDERATLVGLYGAGSDWAKRHEYNAKALEAAAKTLGSNLRDRAVLLDQAAGNSVDPTRARDLYLQTAQAMSDYLQQFPNSTEWVDFGMRLADIRLFQLQQYKEASELYSTIRDRKGTDAGVQMEAAVKSMESRAKLVTMAQENGTEVIPERLFDFGAPKPIAKVESPEGNDPTLPNKVIPVEIPATVQGWMAQAQRFIDLPSRNAEDTEAQAQTAFLLGKIYFRYGFFDKAREQYRKVMEKYPKQDDLISYCFVDIARTYRVENDLDNLEKVSVEMQEAGKGDPNDLASTLESIKTARFDARFQRANELLKQAEEAMTAQKEAEARELYSKAARELERVVDENPSYHNADAALLQAADAFEKVQLYDKAAGLYRRLVDEERFRKSKYRELAMKQLAANYEKFFNFEGAVATYRRIVSEFSQGTNVRLSLLSMYELLENDQKYAEAAMALEEYIRLFSKDPDKVGDYLYRIAGLYEKAHDRTKAAQAYEEFTRKMRKNPKFTQRVMTAFMKLGRWAEEDGKLKSARVYYESVRDLYGEAGQEPGSKAAALCAEAVFRLAESRFSEFSTIRIEEGRFKQQIATATRKREKLEELEKVYLGVEQYVVADWVVAAYYRIGMLWKDLAETMENTPYPSDLPKDEINLQNYRADMRDLRARFQDEAIGAWRFGMEVARNAGVSNEWSQLTLKELNEFASERSKFPLYRDVKQIPSSEPMLHFSVGE